MTAVEWLIQEHFGGIDNCASDFRNKIYQALEMEENQIKDAWDNGCTYVQENSKQYYNETFKTK